MKRYQDQIDEFKVGKYTHLTGFTSTTEDRRIALEFAMECEVIEDL